MPRDKKMVAPRADGFRTLETETAEVLIVSNKRRGTGLIDHEVQTSLIWRVTLHWGALIMGQGLGLLFWTVFTALPDIHAGDVFHRFSLTFLPVMVISLSLLPVFLLDTVKLTNRFAGPIQRLRRTLKSIVAGEQVEPLKFRDNDFWQALAVDFNQAMKLRSENESAPDTSAHAEPDDSTNADEADVADSEFSDKEAVHA